MFELFRNCSPMMQTYHVRRYFLVFSRETLFLVKKTKQKLGSKLSFKMAMIFETSYGPGFTQSHCLGQDQCQSSVGYRYLQDLWIAKIVIRIVASLKNEFVGTAESYKNAKCFPQGKLFVICHENTFESWAQGMIQSISSLHIELNISKGAFAIEHQFFLLI